MYPLGGHREEILRPRDRMDRLLIIEIKSNLFFKTRLKRVKRLPTIATFFGPVEDEVVMVPNLRSCINTIDVLRFERTGETERDIQKLRASFCCALVSLYSRHPTQHEASEVGIESLLTSCHVPMEPTSRSIRKISHVSNRYRRVYKLPYQSLAGDQHADECFKVCFSHPVLCFHLWLHLRTRFLNPYFVKSHIPLISHYGFQGNC